MRRGNVRGLLDITLAHSDKVHELESYSNSQLKDQPIEKLIHENKNCNHSYDKMFGML